MDLSPLFSDPTTTSPRDTFLYYWDYELHAVRHGQWKLQFPCTDKQAPDLAGIGNGGDRGAVTSIRRDLALFDLAKDPAESTNIADMHPEVVSKLRELARGARKDLGDKLRKAKGTGRRPQSSVE